MRHENWQKRKCKVIVTNYKDRYIVNYNYLSEYNYLSVFFWTSVISKVFVATLSMCFCLFAIPFSANKYLLQVSGRSPKARGEICEKLTVEIALLY